MIRKIRTGQEIRTPLGCKIVHVPNYYYITFTDSLSRRKEIILLTKYTPIKIKIFFSCDYLIFKKNQEP